VKGDRHPCKVRMKETHGFTLIEVLIVMVIVGILATSVVFMFANPSANVKTQAFTMLGDMNRARSEAVTRNEDVLVDFTANGYQICVDATGGVPPIIGDDDCSDETGENFIQETIFHPKVEYYKPAALPAGGPATTPPEADTTANNLIGAGVTGIVLNDGTAITNFTLEPDGTLEDGIAKNINIVFYAPKLNQSAIDGTPYAVTVSASSGRIRISRWTGGAWSTK
jgi:prepilin-type N-terminal cleavage/methylation domain-containing protein